MQILRRVVLLIAVALIVASIAFALWASAAAPPMPEAIAALTSDENVDITTSRWLIFTPRRQQPTTGLIFYPGARVDPRAYAPAAKEIAAQGHLVVIVPMPLNLAIFGTDKATGVINAYPHVQRWAIGGHSFGGVMAATFARRHPDKVSGLVLWASYPLRSDDISSLSLAVISIYGSLDGLTTIEDIMAAAPLLPDSARLVLIEGGNHAQFGWYGEQAGDRAATISRQAQQEQTIKATLYLLRSL